MNTSQLARMPLTLPLQSSAQTGMDCMPNSVGIAIIGSDRSIVKPIGRNRRKGVLTGDGVYGQVERVHWSWTGD